METIFPPFDPDESGNRPRVRRMRQIPIRMILPNLVTLLGLCAGLTAIRMAIESRYGEAIAMIVIAAVLDAVDGRVARLLRSASRFGAELDSLADFVNFGVAPAIILYVWALDAAHSLGWIAALVFSICAALRLARFNVAIDGPTKPDWHGNFFTGVPAPAGALVVLLPLYLENLGVPVAEAGVPVVLFYTFAIGLLMVSRLPTWSGKKMGARIPRELVLPMFVIVVIAAASLLSYPWHVLAFGTIAYLMMLPFGWRRFRQLEQETLAAQPPEA